MKHCCKCKQTKENSLFSKDSSRKDGFSHRCRECDNEKVGKYGKSKIGRFKVYIKAAKWRGYEFQLSYDEFLSYWNKKCFYCDIEIDGIGLDRKDNRIGYIISNVVPCCSSCNWLKGAIKKEDLPRLKKIIEKF